MLRIFIGLVAIIVCQNLLTEATLTPKSRKSNTKNTNQKLEIKSGPQDVTVFDRKLVTEDFTAKDVIQYHQSFFREVDEYRIDAMVLGFVTPWNNHGYDVAKIFGNKFTHISPVWLQIKRKGSKSYEMTGTHDIDKQWMADVRNAGRMRKLKIVPRVLFERWTADDYTKLLNNEKEASALIKTLVAIAKKYNFNGFVLEIWPQLAGNVDDQILINLVKTVGDNLAQESLDLILVIPPRRGHVVPFTERHFDELYDHVSAFSLMTYDFSSPTYPGPNAPISWVENCIETISSNRSKREKILTGFNFYGNLYTQGKGQAIVGHEYVKLLNETDGKIVYDSQNAEHYIEYQKLKKRHLIFYPSLYSISKKINLINELGTGLSIWELGQGLDYFYDLL